jgi:hypothetical protein
MPDYELVLTPQYIHAQRLHPSPGFTIGAKLKNPRTCPVTVLQLSAAVRLTEPYVPIQTRRPFSFHRPVIEPGESINVNLDVDFSRSGLRAVEEARAGRTEIGLTFEVDAIVAETAMVKLEGREQSVFMPVSPDYARVSVMAPDGRVGSGHRIPRDEWLGLLKEFRYADLEVFELPELAVGGQGASVEAQRAIAAAVSAFRSSNPEETLTRCRAAFEAIATDAGQTDDVRAGFDALFKKVLESPQDEPKRKPLNDIIDALGKFQHLGRHLKHPFTPVNRADALVSLRISLALFEYFSTKAK